MPVAFDTSGMEQYDERTWFDPRTGDQVSLTYIGMVPDLPAGLDELPLLRHRLALETAEVGALIEAHVVFVDTVPTLFQLLKVPIPDQGTGQAFIAAFTVPKESCSAVLRIQCAEIGETGVREAAVFGQVGADVQPHPYAPNVRGLLPWHVADDARWDRQFPDHPLSRARAWAQRMMATARIDPGFARLPPFRPGRADTGTVPPESRPGEPRLRAVPPVDEAGAQAVWQVPGGEPERNGKAAGRHQAPDAEPSLGAVGADGASGSANLGPVHSDLDGSPGDASPPEVPHGPAEPVELTAIFPKLTEPDPPDSEPQGPAATFPTPTDTHPPNYEPQSPATYPNPPHPEHQHLPTTHPDPPPLEHQHLTTTPTQPDPEPQNPTHLTDLAPANLDPTDLGPADPGTARPELAPPGLEPRATDTFDGPALTDDVDPPPIPLAAPAAVAAPVSPGDVMHTVLVGMPVGGYLPLWLSNEITYWRMTEPDVVRDRLGVGLESRTEVDNQRFREAAMFSPDKHTLFLMDRFRDRTGHLGGTTTQLLPATEEEALAAADDKAMSELYRWLGEIVLAAGERDEFVAVETGGWHVPREPVVLIMLRTDGAEWHSVVETSPVPVGAPVWRDQQPVDGDSQLLVSPATEQTLRAAGLLTRFAVTTWPLHPFQLGLSFGPNPTLGEMPTR